MHEEEEEEKKQQQRVRVHECGIDDDASQPKR